jgi:hypothetical protein
MHLTLSVILFHGNLSPQPHHVNKRGEIVDKMIGKKFIISGMAIEIVADDGDRWETRNLTTRETVFINKSVLHDAIKLAKAEEISPSN